MLTPCACRHPSHFTELFLHAYHFSAETVCSYCAEVGHRNAPRINKEN